MSENDRPFGGNLVMRSFAGDGLGRSLLEPAADYASQEPIESNITFEINKTESITEPTLYTVSALALH